MPLTDTNILKDTSGIQEAVKPNPAVVFPDNYSHPASDANIGSGDGDKGFNFTPNQPSSDKVYANTPNYYQPKEVPNRYNRFVLGADNESIQADIQSGWDRAGNMVWNVANKIGAYVAQNVGFIGGAAFGAIGGSINYVDKWTGGKGDVVEGGNAISMMTDNFLTN